MHSTTANLPHVINPLIEICHDSKKGFAAAAQAVHDPLLAKELLRYSSQRGGFLSDLEAALRQFGEQPVDHGSVTGAMHRGWMNIKTSLTSDDPYLILTECERGEHVAVAAYREAAVTSLPVSIGNMVMTQCEVVERVHNRIRSLRDKAESA